MGEIVNGAIKEHDQPQKCAIDIVDTCWQQQVHGCPDNAAVSQEKKDGKSIDD